MTGIQYVTDARGRRVAVQIDLRRHKSLWEDIQDALVANSRRKERSIPLAEAKAALMKQRRAVSADGLASKRETGSSISPVRESMMKRGISWQARVNRDWRFYFTIDDDTYIITNVIPHPK